MNSEVIISHTAVDTAMRQGFNPFNFLWVVSNTIRSGVTGWSSPVGWEENATIKWQGLRRAVVTLPNCQRFEFVLTVNGWQMN